MTKEVLKQQVSSLPNEPGVYQYYNEQLDIIYVGKAKDLKKRVSSYFRKNVDSRKTKNLVNAIHTLKHIVVPTESDALILENTLIKEHQPKYNILLRDDKTYPWICIKKERYPRVFATRKVIQDGSEYFGPFTNAKTIRVLLDLINELYPLRTCHYDLNQENIASEKYKVCLEYHIGNCLAPCIGKQTTTHYEEAIGHIRAILQGKFNQVKDAFKKEMTAAAETLQFEHAQKVKLKMEALQHYQAKSAVVSAKINAVDVCTIVSDETTAFINFLQVAYGSIVRFHSLSLKKKLDETDEEILRVAIVELRRRFQSTSKEVLLPFQVDLGEDVRVTVPKIGDKKHLLSLSLRNAKQNRLEQLKQIKLTDPEQHAQRIMAQMQRDLRLSELPTHIECFDNSNIQGSNPVAACVVFRQGKPSKKEYRHYGIKTVEGPDDYASMEEVVYRRYKRLLNEGHPLPQLVVIDGGKGQLSAAIKSFDVLGIRGKVAILGIAKRLEELYFPDDPIPLYLDKRSETLRIVQQLRNEAHRFGIRLHRNKRSKGAIHSTLESIPGVGEKTIIELLKKFKSVKRIKAASKEALTQILGPKKAKIVYEHLHNETT
ncbi:MAG: excinuclease ABC subunit UvrC [Flavobacteriaceae bacterium]|nr:excinuclease ABC subunit UvrC [Flavobacteriaceae bacterium]